MSIEITIDGGQVLFGLAALVSAVVGPLLSIRAVKQTAAKIEIVATKVDAVAEVAEKTHQSTNSKMDALIVATAKGSLAEGVMQGRAEVRAEQGSSTAAASPMPGDQSVAQTAIDAVADKLKETP